MSILDRFILMIYSFIIGGISLFLVFVPFTDKLYQWINHIFENYRMNVQNAMIPMIFLIISIRFLVSSIRLKRDNYYSIIRHTAYGELKISLNALEEMAKKAIECVSELKDIQVTAKPVDEGVLIQVYVLALSDTNIPETTIKAQESIKKSIETHTGISVKEIKVTISNIANYKKGRVE